MEENGHVHTLLIRAQIDSTFIRGSIIIIYAFPDPMTPFLRLDLKERMENWGRMFCMLMSECMSYFY